LSGAQNRIARVLWGFSCAPALAFGACAVPQSSSSGSSGTRLYNEHANARSDIAAALSHANESHKLVLLEFGAEWCPGCHTLAALLADPTVQPFLEAHFEVVRIDIGGVQKKNRDLTRKYAIRETIPAAVVLDSAGELIAIMQGSKLGWHETAGVVLADLRQWVAAKP
jgi:thioredoxin-related protein